MIKNSEKENIIQKETWDSVMNNDKYEGKSLGERLNIYFSELDKKIHYSRKCIENMKARATR